MHRHLLTTVLALAIPATPVLTADTIWVCDSGCDYSSIQAAIDAATDGDVIQLFAGPYEEGAQIDMRGKAITLKGLPTIGVAATTIMGQNSHRILACRSGETNATIIQDLRFSGGLGDGSGGGGLLIQGASPTIINCTFESNKIGEFQSGGGVLVDGGSPHFIFPVFNENGPVKEGQTMSINGGGMAILTGHVTMDCPSFTNNHAHYGGGLYVLGGASAHLSSRGHDETDYAEGIIFKDNMAYGMNSGKYAGRGVGGGIINMGDLTIDGTDPDQPDDQPTNRFETNIATASNEQGGQGGGIAHFGPNLYVNNVDFTANSATLTPFNQKGNGGGIYAETRISNLVKVDFRFNYPNGIEGFQGPGAGLQGEPPVVALEGCTIYGNGDEQTDQQIDGMLVLHLGDNHISKHAPPSGCPSDLNGDGQIDAADLGLLIAAWGLCP